jgi:transposase
VATDMMGVSGRAMIEALIAGERDPHVLAELARGRLRVKHAALVQALTGRFDAHHAELARILLDAYDAADAQIRRPNARIEAVIAALPAAQGVDADGTTGPHAGIGPNAPVLPALARLDEIPGVGAKTAQVIIAEIGLDMTRFPTAAHLVSWARLSPRTVQSGPATVPAGPARATPTSRVCSVKPPQPPRRPTPSSAPRYRRLVKRRGKLKALVAVARSILTTVWHLLADSAARYHDLGADCHTRQIDTEPPHPQPRPPTRDPRLQSHPRCRSLTVVINA